jgi:hypothetical protein
VRDQPTNQTKPAKAPSQILKASPWSRGTRWCQPTSASAIRGSRPPGTRMPQRTLQSPPHLRQPTSAGRTSAEAQVGRAAARFAPLAAQVRSHGPCRARRRAHSSGDALSGRLRRGKPWRKGRAGPAAAAPAAVARTACRLEEVASPLLGAPSSSTLAAKPQVCPHVRCCRRHRHRHRRLRRHHHRPAAPPPRSACSAPALAGKLAHACGWAPAGSSGAPARHRGLSERKSRRRGGRGRGRVRGKP